MAQQPINPSQQNLNNKGLNSSQVKGYNQDIDQDIDAEKEDFTTEETLQTGGSRNTRANVDSDLEDEEDAEDFDLDSEDDEDATWDSEDGTSKI